MKIMSETKNAVVKAEPTFKTNLARVNDAYLPMITDQLESNNITFSEYAKSCVVNAIAAINNTLDAQGISWNDTSLDTSNITQVLLSVATLQLNAAPTANEVYFQIRNASSKGVDANGKPITVWKKKIEMGVQADGFDSLVELFGRNVKKVYPHWLVREDDDFKYPRYVGVELTPPEWQPKGTGKVVRVVYPILSNDNTVDYYISERADVKRNLIAHISNNLMNETFGVCADRYKATDAQKTEIAEKKKALLSKAKELDLEALLDSAEFDKYISPAWKEEQSRESMIIRKMRNNIVKKIPKSFASSLANELFNESTDETYKTYNEEYVEVEEQELEPVALIEHNGVQVDAETGEIKNQPEF
jgi:hypothetical protein